MAMKIYKHINATDAAAQFLEVKETAKGYKVKISWINIVNPEHIYPLNYIEDLFIPRKDMKNWHVYKWHVMRKGPPSVQDNPEEIEIEAQQHEGGRAERNMPEASDPE